MAMRLPGMANQDVNRMAAPPRLIVATEVERSAYLRTVRSDRSFLY